ncbi:hypothetical protein SAMN05444166_3380 [Singulisphaera sp. GP187]|uniref:hypothetical protein n=1 Tax=Singulisphaera sp. GP187 TaxID=1882752 RepID=UPI000926B303|nr:hypothetical protein [Singulisphaera sp. GP187]SIO27235.1 hypothetical protein SAMN05444166_3380 [Singulisphaera sp. GP187]
MARGRLSILSPMSIVVVIAIGFAALKKPTELWASAIFTLALVVFLTSILGAAACRGRSRMTWLGSALFGGAYLALCFGACPRINNEGLRPPPLLVTVLLNKLKSDGYLVAKDWTVAAVILPQNSSQLSVSPNEYEVNVAIAPPRNTFLTYTDLKFDVSPYKQISHSIGSLLFAAIGGLLSLAFTTRNGES